MTSGLPLAVQERAHEPVEGFAALAPAHRRIEALDQLGRGAPEHGTPVGVVPVEGAVFGHGPSVDGGLPPELGADTVVDIHQGGAMAQVSDLFSQATTAVYNLRNASDTRIRRSGRVFT